MIKANVPPTIIEAIRGFFPLNKTACDAPITTKYIPIIAKRNGGRLHIFKIANNMPNKVIRINSVPMLNRLGIPAGLGRGCSVPSGSVWHPRHMIKESLFSALHFGQTHMKEIPNTLKNITQTHGVFTGS
jgi:hypothetical protein